VFKIANNIIFLAIFFAIGAQAQEPVTDPTKPLGFSGSGTSTINAQDSIQLTSILIAEDRKVAIINGQTMRENQTLKGIGATVKKIDADAVTLQQNGKVWRVALNSTAIRK
jgi:MSHA biogenesis protein MshK